MRLIGKAFTRIIETIAAIGAEASDDEELRLQKSILVLSSFPFIITGLGWGFMYIVFGAKAPALIPLSYSLFSILSIIHFSITKKFRIFRFNQLVLILLLPFALMLSLGGFVQGSAVILWSLIAPLGAMLFDKPKLAPRWFLAFLFLVLISGILEPFNTMPNHLDKNKIILFFVINLTGVGAIIFSMLYYFVGKKNLFQERSEALLLNILPKEIVSILRKDRRTIADHFENASILFADIVNFTPLSSSLTPADLVELLNEVFSKFDALTEKYDLEKIKTIGDCYMVASGVPRPRQEHAIALTNMALDMLEIVAKDSFNGHQLQFRIGINSGPVIAGVIGQKKFSYDLWGDSVNIASRMESHGAHGIIQISEPTYALIRNDFICESHGTIHVKGKGDMPVWYVLSRNTGN